MHHHVLSRRTPPERVKHGPAERHMLAQERGDRDIHRHWGKPDAEPLARGLKDVLVKPHAPVRERADIKDEKAVINRCHVGDLGYDPGQER